MNYKRRKKCKVKNCVSGFVPNKWSGTGYPPALCTECNPKTKTNDKSKS